MAAELELRTLLDDHAAVGEIGAEVGGHDLKSHGGGDDLGLGIFLCEGRDAGGVVGLHVMDNEVVGGAPVERHLEVSKPLVHEVRVHGVHNGNLLLAENNVGVVGHAVFADVVLALEQVDVVVVDADVLDVLGNLH